MNNMKKQNTFKNLLLKEYKEKCLNENIAITFEDFLLDKLKCDSDLYRNFISQQIENLSEEDKLKFHDIYSSNVFIFFEVKSKFFCDLDQINYNQDIEYLTSFTIKHKEFFTNLINF